MAEHTGAVLTEDRIRAIAGRSAGEDNLFDGGIERSGQARNVSFPIGGENEMASRSGNRRPAASGSPNV